MTRVSLNGVLRRPSHKTVQVKPGLFCRPQDVGGAKATGYLLEKVANREESQTKRKKFVAVNRTELRWKSEKMF